MKRKRILLDCDGILADFCTACFNLIEQHTGVKHTHDEVTQFDLFAALGRSNLKPLMKELSAQSGWCLGFPIYTGAQNFVRELEQIGEVVIVTSPMTTPFWVYEREIWLNQHFSIPKQRIVSTEGKHYVDGDVFIDDSDVHCVKWSAEHPSSLTILWDAPYNRHFNVDGTTIRRGLGQSDVIEIVRQL